MVQEKTSFRALLSSLEDDPFLQPGGSASGPFSEESADSIFAISRAPDEPAAAAKSLHKPTAGRLQPAPDAAPARTPAEAPRPAALPQSPKPPAEDAVLKILVQHGVLKKELLPLLSSSLQSLPAGVPPWRAALALPGAAQEKILAVAAHLHNVPFADLKQNPRYMLATTLESLPLSFRKQCFALRLLPFACEISKVTGQVVLKLATNDPLRPEVDAFMGGLKMEARLYYAPASMLTEAIQHARAERGETSSSPSNPACAA